MGFARLEITGNVKFMSVGNAEWFAKVFCMLSDERKHNDVSNVTSESFVTEVAMLLAIMLTQISHSNVRSSVLPRRRCHQAVLDVKHIARAPGDAKTLEQHAMWRILAQSLATMPSWSLWSSRS
jgi:hypothetical protein